MLVPDAVGAALVRHADAGDVLRRQSGFFHSFFTHVYRFVVDFIKIVLDHILRGRVLGEFSVADADDLEAPVEYQRSGTGCAFVDNEDVVSHDTLLLA
ncbi:hypothetical protein SDC9_205122 [bioreactor metagenome]|uniref:Uncharacterized protein n=1 Tax=bioreactor metagenome TaxID=1076179 RepID=A0A645J172_9ZZZZ